MRRILALLLALALSGCLPAPAPYPIPVPVPPTPGPGPGPAPVPDPSLPTWAVAVELRDRINGGATLDADAVKASLGKPFDAYDPPVPAGAAPIHVAGYRVTGEDGNPRNLWVTYVDGVSKNARDA